MTSGLCWLHCLLWNKNTKSWKCRRARGDIGDVHHFITQYIIKLQRKPTSCVTKEINSPCTASTGDASLVLALSVPSLAPTSSGRQWLPASEEETIQPCSNYYLMLTHSHDSSTTVYNQALIYTLEWTQVNCHERDQSSFIMWFPSTESPSDVTTTSCQSVQTLLAPWAVYLSGWPAWRWMSVTLAPTRPLSSLHKQQQ